MYSIVNAAESFCPGEPNESPDVIWCDDFEDDIPLTNKYFEFDDDDGDFSRVSNESISGQYSLRARWQNGEVDAGHFMYNFGRNPLGSQKLTNQDFRDIYWRIYIKLQDGFIGYPDKLTRATIFAGSDRQQAMIAHIWASTNQPQFLLIDPVSGIDNNSNLVTTTWNDFNNLIWLGSRQGTTPIYPGRWYCVESHVKLNTLGLSDGIMEFWIDGNLETQRTDLAWTKNWTDYGINSIFFSNYTNEGSPAEQERYLDSLVISTKRIGCLNEKRPNPPSNLETY